jgi:hypothetical protein
MIHTKAMVKIDFRNALHAVSRDCIFEAVKNHFPALLPWVHFWYSVSPFLFAGTLPCPVDVLFSKRTDYARYCLRSSSDLIKHDLDLDAAIGLMISLMIPIYSSS